MPRSQRSISVIGLGYVGLPVAVAFGHKHRVVGFDINAERIAELKRGEDRTGEVDGAALKAADILFTADATDLKSADFHIVAVPTPIDDAYQPDLSALRDASRSVGRQLKRGDIVVYESTVYPGLTEEVCLPILERESGLTGGKDFTLGYSPERINPGDKEHTFTTITKVVSGQDAATLEIVAEVYGSVVTAGVHCAASIRVAEAAKVIENTQRDLNIALMNELATLFNRMGIDTRDVLAAARTKWNFLPFEPGLVGGHCIGVDPYYLTYAAERLGYHPEVILAGRRINDGMGAFVAREAVKRLIRRGGVIQGARVTVLGLTFKENVPDLRNSKVVDMIRELEGYGLVVQVNDPLASAAEADEEHGITLTPIEQLSPAQAVVLAVAHEAYRREGWALAGRLLDGGAGLVVDVRGALPPAGCPDSMDYWRL
jgi:UDP-N-acetyl-D-galactosamine dehydrogenase